MECIIVECRCCHRLHCIDVMSADYEKWVGGELVQKAFPYLSIDKREILISHICGECFDALFD